MLTGLILALSGMILQPLNSHPDGSCTMDAYLHCRMREYKERLQPLNYIEQLATYRNKLRTQRVGTGKTDQEIYSMVNVLNRLVSTTRIKDFARLDRQKAHNTPFPFLIAVSNYDIQGLVFKHNPYSSNGHVMCVVGETDDHRVVLNGRGKFFGYSGYNLVEKGGREYYSFSF